MENRCTERKGYDDCGAILMRRARRSSNSVRRASSAGRAKRSIIFFMGGVGRRLIKRRRSWSAMAFLWKHGPGRRTAARFRGDRPIVGWSGKGQLGICPEGKSATLAVATARAVSRVHSPKQASESERRGRSSNENLELPIGVNSPAGDTSPVSAWCGCHGTKGRRRGSRSRPPGHTGLCRVTLGASAGRSASIDRRRSGGRE